MIGSMLKKTSKIYFVAVILTILLLIFGVALNFKTFFAYSASPLESFNLEVNENGYYEMQDTSILAWLQNNDNLIDGYYEVTVNDEIYNIHLYVLDGSQTWSESQTFGDSNDVATSSAYAKNMVAVKVNGDLTIDSGVTITTYSNSYGGPKGFTLFVTGKLTNNGTITMTAKGAKAEGQDVYLWYNSDGTYEYVPATGASGGDSKSGADGSNAGKSGSGRQTGGGGSGARYSGSSVSGKGGTGTSYSGGAGGGAGVYGGTGTAGSSVGGAGGKGVTAGAGNNNLTLFGAGGGAGNPGGSGTAGTGSNGTGGLLIIYADNYINNGSITSHGSKGGTGASTGGSSGGGSINLFINNDLGIDKLGVVTATKYKEILSTVTVTGGSATSGSSATGGTGGTGTINIGQIREGQYYDLTEAIEQDKESFSTGVTIEGDSILSILEKNDLKSGYYNFAANNVKYQVHLINYDGDQTWSGNQTFGDATDVATSSTNAQNMVIVKVNGNLTIDSGVTVTTYSNSYGGPKGFLLYVTGELTNNGTITMTGKGAKATGQNVYLWHNTDGTYEYVPATGGTGGVAKSGSNGSNAGTPGTGRQTGGGGSGARYNGSSVSGKGGTGTSYSGGAGGGAGTYGSAAGTAGSSVGGAGGTAKSGTTATTYSGGGGAGNPGGSGVNSGGTGSTGTGGLLIIYADNYINNGSITSHGSKGGTGASTGGSSGGGSINLFINNDLGIDKLGVVTATKYEEILSTVTVTGGSATSGSYATGGKGGTGTINIGQIREGQYYDLTEAIEQDKESFSAGVTIEGESILRILEENDLEDGYYNFVVNNVKYQVHLINYDGDQTWSGNQTFGDATDVATSSTDAQNMVIVKVNGNLTIDSGVTVTTYSNSYGGPKGFTLFVTGKLTNNGTITMTGKGAKATGQDVYLWYNSDGTYEYVPATGASGGVAKSGSNGSNAGKPGSGRQTGGGGSGGRYNGSSVSGKGGTGTSYSGGTGGGAGTYGSAAGTAGSSVGGAGGTAKSATTATTYSGGGGAGNPGGSGVNSGSAGTNGTGGLLVIYAEEYENNGSVTAQGKSGGTAVAGGGSSGGGSINIFYAISHTKGTVSYSGGSAVGTSAKGGTGGTGTVNYTQIVWDVNLTNPILESLTADVGTLEPNFESKTFEYDLYLEPDDSVITIDAKTLTGYEDAYTITGLGTYSVPVGESTYKVIVTSEIGYVNTYVITTHREASSYPYLDDIQIDGESILDFSPTRLYYTVDVGSEQESVDITTVVARHNQTVYGIGELEIKTGTTTHTIEVLSEDGSTSRVYTIIFKKGNSSKLKSLNIPDAYTMTPEFNAETTNYEITIPESIVSLEVEAIPHDSSATVTITGNGYIKPNQGATIIITVTQENAGTTVYTVKASRGTIGQTSYDFSCTGEYQEFEVPTDGYYKVELWGASGGAGHRNNNYTYSGGAGAYTTGTIYLDRGEKIYVYVGCQGGKAGSTAKYQGGTGGWNGGATGGNDSNKDSAPDEAGGGGGATDIRLIPTSDSMIWDEFESLQSRIMVAAGGAGGTYSYTGHAGGLYTNKTNTYSFGMGQVGYAYSSGSGGGGGGYFGGITTNSSGGRGYGGTSYVSGLDVLYAITETSTSSDITLSQSSEHYSGYVFTDVQALSGSVKVPSITGGYSTGNTGNGYAIITYMGSPNENNFLSSISVSIPNDDEIQEEVSYTPEFKQEVLEYYVTVDTDVTEITVSARPEDNTATISGLGNYDISAGTTDIKIAVTAENGDINIYHVYVTREADTNPYPLDIVINGLVPSLCEVNEEFCFQTPEFNPEIYEYSLIVPSRIKQLYFDVSKAHDYQTVVGDGKTSLDGGENIITIEVTSEDGLSETVYNYYVIRDMTGNTDLKVLEIINPVFEINYDPDILTYYLSVPNEYTQINEMNIETDDEEASYIVVGNENFEVGMNYVYIIVTASNGEIQTYTLCVYRERSSNVYLSELKVTNGETNYELFPEFTKIYTGAYQTTVGNEINSVEISATAEASTTTVTGTGVKELSTGTNAFNIITTAEDGTTEVYTLEINREKNNNVNITNIEVLVDEQKQILTPAFDTSILEYTVQVPEGTTSVEINATSEVDTTIYKLLDNNTIKVGSNVKRVMSIAEDGTTQTYVITINRNANSNNYLSDIIVNDESLSDFEKEIPQYNLTVSNDVDKVTINGIKENELATIKGNGTYYLNVGENEIILLVTAEDGKIREYTLTITRQPNSNADLSSITTNVGVLVPEFSSNELTYTLNVENTIDTINIVGIASETTTTVTGNGIYTLESGSNYINLVTLAEDGTTKTYVIEVIKDKSDNDNIKYLLLEEGIINPSFDSNIVSYTAYVPNEVTKGTFHVELEDDKATYEIIGNENYIVGENKVIVRVTSESGKTKDYNVVVVRQEAEIVSNYLSDLVVNQGTLTPTFEKEIPYYEVKVEYSVKSIKVSGTLEDDNAKITGFGTYSLSVGENLIPIKVVGTDGKIRSYQIVVTRNKNTEARLSAMTISGGIINPSFDKNTYEYSVETSENELTFNKITPMDSEATYEVIGNNFEDIGEYTVIIRVTAANEITTQDYSINVTRVASNNNNLSSLSVSGYEINPSFDENIALYYVTVENDINSILVEAISEDKNATIIGDGVRDLEVGDNNIVVEVTSESGNVKTYTVVVTREGDDNNLISKLIVNNGILNPEFISNNYSYDISVPYEEESVDFTVILDSETSTYKIVGNSLNVGDNIVTILVTAENGDVSTYKFNVTRNHIISALLSDMSVSNYKFTSDFNPYVMSYDLLVDYEVTSLDLNITAMDSEATYEISGNSDFIVGENEVLITVTSSDGSLTEVYKIMVKRQAEVNTYLDYLYTSEGDFTPIFNQTELNYSIDVDTEVETIEFIGEAVDKSNTVTGIGEHSLQKGKNIFQIVVESPTKVKRTYYVTVNRAYETENDLTSLTVKTDSTTYELSPEFDSNIKTYNVTVPVGTNKVTLSGTVSNTATVTGLDTYDIVVGENTIDVKVTSESGDVNTYTVIITREASTNNYLTNLVPSVGTLTPSFDYYTTEYKLDLNSGASVLSFEYATEDSNAIVSGTSAQAVPDGTSTRQIIVTAEDGSTRTYQLTINKENSDNAKLSSLSISGYSLNQEFDPNIYEYNITVENAKQILLSSEVVAIAEDSNAIVSKSLGLPLSTSEVSDFIIKVTAPNGFTTNEYVIHVTREKSSNANLASLSPSSGSLSPSFATDTTEYELQLDTSVTELSFEYTTEESNAVVNGIENEIVLNGKTTRKISVLAEDGTSKIYTITVIRGADEDLTLSDLQVNIGYLENSFESNTLEYTWIIPINISTITSENIEYILSDESSNVEVTESIDMTSSDEKIFNITILSQDNTVSNTYKLHLEYEDEIDLSLESLTSSEGLMEPDFNSDIYEYDIYVYEDIESTIIEASSSEEVTIIGTGEVTLENETTVHNVVLTAPNGSTNTYTLNIHRTILRDQHLKDLGLNTEGLPCDSICTLNPEFKSDTYQYSITVPYEYDELDIYYETMNEQQTVEIYVDDLYTSGYVLPLGNTEVVVSVYDGLMNKTNEYTISITREKSSNNKLNSLEVTDVEGNTYLLDKEFNSDILEYSVEVSKDIDEVVVNAIPQSDAASVYITGNTYLQNGNNDVVIAVTAANGITKNYILHVIKEPEYNSYIKNITVSTGVFWDLSPTFKTTEFNYTTTVSSMYDTVTIEANPVSLTTEISGTGEFNIVTGPNIFTLVSTAEDGSTSIYTVTVIKEVSRNVNLASLIIEEGNISPNFESGTSEYEINVDSEVTNLTIHAIPEDSDASVIITGNNALVSGDNIVNIIVMSSDKSASKTYQLTVHKEKSSNANLNGITVSDENSNVYESTPELQNDVLEYYYTVPHDVEKVLLEVETANNAAKVKGGGEEYLDYGENHKQITVIAEDGTVQIYKLIIYREYNLNLSLIVTDQGEITPTFDSSITSYTLDVSSDVENITVIALKESSIVSVSGNGTYELEAGENVIEFVVTAPDNSSKIYKLIVTKQLSSNNYIESLVLHQGVLSPKFDKETQAYSANIINTLTSVGMDIILEDETATYEVINNSDFTDGENIVTVRVTAEDGTTRDYIINVKLQEASYFSNRLTNLTVSEGSYNPDFDPDINYYAATVPNYISSLVIDGTLEQEDATVTGLGTVDLDVGRNVFQIVVTSLDGIDNTYTLIIYRSENTDATLSNLKVEGYSISPIFRKYIENYTVEVDGDETELNIVATPSDLNSIVNITGNTDLKTGENTITIEVIAPDKITTKTYTVIVNKGVSTNNYLSSLSVSGYDLDKKFDKTYNGPYYIDVGSAVNSILINAVPEVNTTTVTGDGVVSLNKEQNIIYITSTSESGDVRTYTLVVNKRNSSDSTLQNIILSDGTLSPSFDSSILNYEVQVDEYVTEIAVTGVLSSSSNATVYGNGLYQLIDSETLVSLSVMAEDNSTTTYTVKIVKEKSYSSKIEELIIKDGQIMPEFNKNTETYNVLIPYEITSLDMIIKLEDEEATYEIIGNENFSLGSNKVQIVVTSRDLSSETTYTIYAQRQSFASTYLSNLEVVNYEIIPGFNKEIQYYELEVTSDVEKIEITGTVEDESSTVEGFGTYSLEYGTNRFYVTVESASGIERTYSIVITRKYEVENLLLTLDYNVGELDKEFDSYQNEYYLYVPMGTSNVELSGTSSKNSTVSGFGIYDIEVGNTTKTITVTSQSGEINVYSVIIVREASTDAEILNIIPSIGEINYSSEIDTYTLEVNDSDSIIYFDVELSDENATVFGNGVTELNYGGNNITIRVTAEDEKTTKEVTIIVTRLKEIVSIEPSETGIILTYLEEKQITYILNPTDTNYKDVEWISLDETIATVDENGVIKGLGIGSTTIQIRSKHNLNVYANITVNVISSKITSSIYDVVRDEEELYVIGIEPNTIIEDFVESFDNNSSMLHIYDQNGLEITDTETLIGSYMTIKLIINETIYDELVIAVRGDLDGDSYVTAVDLVEVKNLILGTREETFLNKKLADIDLDDYVTAIDLVSVKQYILGSGTLN